MQNSFTSLPTFIKRDEILSLLTMNFNELKVGKVKYVSGTPISFKLNGNVYLKGIKCLIMEVVIEF